MKPYTQSAKPKTLLALALVLILGGGILMARQTQAQEATPQQPHSPQVALGTAFTYQGRLVDEDSPVSDDSCSFQFDLYADPEGGTALDSRMIKDVKVQDGYFSAALDFGSDVFIGDARYLEISVQCTDDTEFVNLNSGRVALNATPYALYALSSASVPWSGIVDVPPGLEDGEDTIYTGEGLISEVQSSTITISLASTYRLPQICADGQIAEWNGTGWECGENTLSVNAGEGLVGEVQSNTITVSIASTYQLPQTCQSGQIAEWNGAGWECSAGIGFWSLTGNAGTTAGTDFLGTTDNQALWLVVNGGPALRLDPASESPNVIGGHEDNAIIDGVRGAAIGGGGTYNYVNKVTDSYGTVSGGYNNVAGDDDTNALDRNYATVSGGANNAAEGYASVVAGGGGFILDMNYGNMAVGDWSTVSGGSNNTAEGLFSTIAGGRSNVATGEYAFAAGRRAKANYDGCFVWADSYDADLPCGADNRFVARASGGVYFYSNSSLSTGVYLPSGSTEWQAYIASDRELKENFEPVDGQDILAQLAEVPITTWNYTASETGARHIGPMAQDFYAAFGVGEDDKHLDGLDVNGVALAAIQGLYERSLALEAENAALRGQINDLEGRLAALEAQMTADPAPNHSAVLNLLPGGWSGLGVLLVGLGLVWASRRKGNAQ